MAPYVPTGRWRVGARDLSFYSGPGELSPDTHLVGRLFYPAASSSASATTTRSTGAPPVLWLNAFNYALGYAHYPLAFRKGWSTFVIKRLAAVAIWCMGGLQQIPALWNADVAAAAPPAAKPAPTDPAAARAAATSTSAPTSSPLHGFPVLLFSHGIAGQRNTYSCICTEMASHGFVVLAIEHADGTASAARLAGPSLHWLPTPARETARQARGTWRWFRGVGEREACTRRIEFRLRELQTALRLLRQLHEGSTPRGLRLSGASDGAAGFLRGRLDLGRVAVAGHSFGGATATLAAASDHAFKCAVALDPWWGALPASCPAVEIWATNSPLLILGSHAFNTPDPVTGKLACNGEIQDQVLEASRFTGGGALLLVPRHSTHSSFDDILLLFGSNPLIQFILQRLLPSPEHTLEVRRAHEINCRSMLHFFNYHLPSPTDLSDAAAAEAWKRPPALRPTAEPRPLSGLAEAAAAAAVAAAEKGAASSPFSAAGEPKPLAPGCEAAYYKILKHDLEAMVLAAINI